MLTVNVNGNFFTACLRVAFVAFRCTTNWEGDKSVRPCLIDFQYQPPYQLVFRVLVCQRYLTQNVYIHVGSRDYVMIGRPFTEVDPGSRQPAKVGQPRPDPRPETPQD